ncbi:STM4014 family protein [Paenibacillus filicis]|uniref:STM4014 family protein n=1 Tax=Paenibacillus filicis TaxID=669464 RepID=A0ABU9DSL7_9BACL
MDPMLLIGNPDNRRTAGLQAARSRLGLPPARVVPYLELLRGEITLAQLAEELAAEPKHAGESGEAGLIIRLDAPGEHFEVERELIALGAPDCLRDERADRLLPFVGVADPEPLSARSARALLEQQGRLYHPSQWFRGYGRLLARLEEEAAVVLPTARWHHPPAAIAAMFDKRHTHHVLMAAGVPVPRQLTPAGTLDGYEALLEAMRSRRMHRVFVKLASGSGACGVVAYQWNPATGAELAVTTIGVERQLARPPLFYNAIKLRRYTDSADIRLILNWLLAHGAHAEQWMPKASYGPRVFDIRQLVVDGEACHSVARVSSTPITNLHLRSERMSLDELGLHESVQAEVRSCAEQALAAFPGARSAGVDVLLGSGSQANRPFVLDVNPFGDLLYRVTYRGLDPYLWQMMRRV